MYGAPLTFSSKPMLGWNTGVRAVYISACSVDGTSLASAARRRVAHAHVDLLGARRELVVDRGIDVGHWSL